MSSLLDNKAGFGLACLLCAAAGAVGVVYLRDGAAPAAVADKPAARAASWGGPLGPGALSPSATQPAPWAQSPDEPKLVDAGGRLAIDPALHKLFDAYLNSGGAPREQELRAYLKRRLQPPALAQAETLAGDYLRYLQAETSLRASQKLAPPDPAGLSMAQVEQMLAWQRQRAQLRERMLGSAVAQAWFESDDADCAAALGDWRLTRLPADAEEVDSNELRERRLHGAVLEERRNERAQACAAQLMDKQAAGSPAA